MNLHRRFIADARRVKRVGYGPRTTSLHAPLSKAPMGSSLSAVARVPLPRYANHRLGEVGSPPTQEHVSNQFRFAQTSVRLFKLLYFSDVIVLTMYTRRSVRRILNGPTKKIASCHPFPFPRMTATCRHLVSTPREKVCTFVHLHSVAH